MKHTLIFASLAIMASNAFAVNICETDPDDFRAGCPEEASSMGNIVPSKNTTICLPPAKSCAGRQNPIEAWADCLTIGGGLMVCNAYPTSTDGIFTYRWTFIRNHQITYEGFAGPHVDVYCSEFEDYQVSVEVSDIFGRSETVNNIYGVCHTNHPN
jgi:hypothetical protein